MALVSALLEILRRPSIWDIWVDLILFVAPLWIAVLVGVLVGWAWKPSWANLGRDVLDFFGSIPSVSSLKWHFPSCSSCVGDDGVARESVSAPSAVSSDCSSLRLETEKPLLVNKNDFQHLSELVEVTDGGPAWIQMMDRSTPNMSYQAWRRDPETGPPQYRSRTVFEDATPELVRDFFWDDNFRFQGKWDDMLIYAETLEECATTGTMLVHWIRKFPFFCSDREYVIGRRIWESNRAYYCVTKGVPNSLPRRNKPRRVDLYYSSWCIRAVESKRGEGQLSACEVLLFHHEDMGIPWEIAKLGVRQGMWGAVKKIEPGLRAYQRERASGASLSRCAFMAQINTKVSADYLKSLETTTTTNTNTTPGDSSEVETLDSAEKPLGRNIPKLLVFGGAIVLACSLDKGLLTKAVIFGVARRFAKIGRRL
ncbi:uncharacterized protein LOC131158814 [Malania oleifera]|uniref:uncharacterized protein LOC131158814 n=1 Tax=Malania oleifera TaxID=397392 RepID=UPI0025AE026B|nr:uncharacterized protein LOC131158814 [Malania oleifera]